MTRTGKDGRAQPAATWDAAGGQIFLDESKAGDYLLVAVLVMPADVKGVRKAVRELVLPGQTHIHMVKESDARRRKILDSISRLTVRPVVYRAGREYPAEVIRRDQCISAMVRDAMTERRSGLIFELDNSLLKRDRRVVLTALRKGSDNATITYRHVRAVTEPLLALPDAIGWAWARGGHWRRRLDPLNVSVVDV